MSETIDLLKTQADKMGVKYSPNIGEAKLQEKINEAIIKESEKPVKKAASAPETKEEKRARKRKEALELVRVRVACYDPTMKKKAGTYIMASNGVVGTVRKFIQFNKPWFMPRILVNVMRESEYQGWIEGKSQYGITQMVSSMEKRYNVTELAQITPQELENIKKRQTVTESLQD
jgi:hypothetical protein